MAKRCLRALAYVAFAILLILKVGRYSRVMVCIHYLLVGLADFLKKGRRRRAPSGIPVALRIFLFKMGLAAVRILILIGIAMINGTVCLAIMVVIGAIWILDWFIKDYDDGELTLDDMLWIDMMDED